MAKVFTDNFNRADNTTLGSPWIDGVSPHSLEIFNNQAYSGWFNGAWSYLVTPLDTPDQQISFKMLFNKTSGQPGYLWQTRIHFRSLTTTFTNNTYFADFKNYADGTVGITLWKIVAGTTTQLTSEIKTACVDGQTYTYSIIVRNNWITVFIDNVIKVYIADSGLTANGNIAVTLYQDTLIDDFIAKDVVDGKYAIISYSSGKVHSSSNFGKTWTLEDVKGDSGAYYYSSVGVSHDGSIMVAATGRTVAPIDGKVYVKKDGFWANRSPTTGDHQWVADLSADGNHVLAGRTVTFGGTGLYISHNSGQTWSNVSNLGSWASIAVNKDGTKFIAGQETGRLYYSSDGSTISEVQPKGAVNGNWSALDISFDGARLMAADSGGKVYYSSDSGANWTNQALNGDVNSQWQTVSMSDDGTYRLAGGKFSSYAWMYENGAWAKIFPGGMNDEYWKCARTNFYGTWSHFASSHNTGGTWYRNRPNFNLVNTVAAIPAGQYWSSFQLGKDDGLFPVTNNQTITAKARIQKLDVTKTATAKARVKYTGVAKTVTARAKVQQFIPVGYDHFLNLTVDHTKVWDSTHTNFAVLVKGSETFLRSVANGGHVESANGYDIIFTSTSGFVQYPHELVSYNPVTGEHIIWVKVPSINNVTDTVFRMYYGNASVVTPTEDKSGTWDTYSKAVYHLQETSGNALDSTINANTMTASGGISYSQPGKIGNSVQFNGTNALFYRSTIFDGSVDEVTMSGWINATVFGSNPREVIHHGYNVSIGIELYTPGTITAQILNTTGGWKGLSVSGKTTATWYRVSITGKKNNFINVYVDGVSIGSAVATNTWFDPGPNYSACIGAYKEVVLGELYHFNGKVEEARYSNTVRSAGWIKTEYYNEADPAFLSYSGEHISINVTVTARARIKKTENKTATAKARIKYTGVNTNVTARANIAVGGTHIFGDEGLIY